ncbi:MAG: VanZ family protein [Candidatus Lokiarchaeota archaeon]|nr:VanZ family protein [Candidatus Lokiarchaeota archaeon]
MNNYNSVYLDYLRMLPFIIYAILLIILSSLSQPYPIQPPKGVTFYLNYILHIIEFAGLSFFAFFGFFKRIKSLSILLFCVLFAISDEVHQFFVPNRFFDFFDILVDCIGIIIGYAFYLSILKIKKEIERKKK